MAVTWGFLLSVFMLFGSVMVRIDPNGSENGSADYRGSDEGDRLVRMDSEVELLDNSWWERRRRDLGR